MREDGKTFIRRYTVALKLWDEFNANFVLLCFSSYKSIKFDTFTSKIRKKTIGQGIKVSPHSSSPKAFQYYETSCLVT